MNARWLVLTDASAPVDSGYDKAAQVVLERPKKAPPPAPPVGGQHPPAVLDVSQLQDLAESAPMLLAAVGGAELRFQVGVSVEGDVSDEVRAKVDVTLSEVSEDLKSG